MSGRMDEDDDSKSLAKLLLIADGKLGKSHYAGMAAAAGFNVLYLDGDVAQPTLKTLPVEARRRIYYLDIADTMLGGAKDSRMIETLQDFTSSITFRWNLDENRLAKRNDTGRIWEIKPARMDHTCVLVIDSWTALCESMMTAAAGAHSVDLANATTSEMRPVYQSSGLKQTQMLQCIRSLRCHVIVLAHPDEFTHTSKPENVKVKDIKETDLKVDWTKMIPKSTSKPASLQMAKNFTDVAWMQVNGAGTQRQLSFRMSEGRVCGGHFDDVKSVDEYSFANLVKKIGGAVPAETPDMSHWFNEIQQTAQLAEAGTAAAPAKPATQILDGTTQTQVKSTGMKNLFAKSPTPAGT